MKWLLRVKSNPPQNMTKNLRQAFQIRKLLDGMRIRSKEILMGELTKLNVFEKCSLRSLTRTTSIIVCILSGLISPGEGERFVLLTQFAEHPCLMSRAAPEILRKLSCWQARARSSDSTTRQQCWTMHAAKPLESADALQRFNMSMEMRSHCHIQINHLTSFQSHLEFETLQIL